MANDIWVPTSADLRRQCNQKLLETEKDFWLATNEMLHGMLESIWDQANKGEDVILQRNGVRVTLTSGNQKGET
jgi:hypothetical protein